MSTGDQLHPGTVLGRYELLLPIAQGGMATVWAARQKGSRGFSKTVAIKTMLPGLSDDPLFEEIYDKNHPRVADACEAWGLARRDRNDLNGAKELLERALSVRETAFGASHPDVGRSLNELLWVDNKKPFLTVNWLGRAATICEESYGPGHPALAQCRRDLALT